jgi:hypothetical protein
MMNIQISYILSNISITLRFFEKHKLPLITPGRKGKASLRGILDSPRGVAIAEFHLIAGHGFW